MLSLVIQGFQDLLPSTMVGEAQGSSSEPTLKFSPRTLLNLIMSSGGDFSNFDGDGIIELVGIGIFFFLLTLQIMR